MKTSINLLYFNIKVRKKLGDEFDGGFEENGGNQDDELGSLISKK